MALTIQERLKDLRVERGLTLEQLAEQTHLSKSALGSYEADDSKDISHYALIKLAKFYGVTSDYLLGLSETKKYHAARPPQAYPCHFGAQCRWQVGLPQDHRPRAVYVPVRVPRSGIGG